MIKLNNINSVRSLSGTLCVPKCLPKGLATAAISISVFLACGDDTSKTSGGSVEDQEVVAISDKTVSGVSQKGPFVNGSSVTVQELDGETLAQTGNSYEGKIKNDMGEFSVKVTKLASQYALLKANGFYRNEVSGEKSKSQVTLYALTDLSNRDEVNVNLLTHLEYERSLYLVSADSMSVADAKKQAEKEVLASFGIDGIFANSEDLSIFGKGDENAALLAISILMQGDLSEADFSERLADYAADIETDGKWDDAKTATEIADWGAAKSLGQSLSYIRTKITDWGLSAEVPAFEKYVDNYWWRNYGLGTCEEKRDGEIKKNENSLSRNYSAYFMCENGAWRVASDTEYDTYQQKCDEDGKIVFGNVNKDYAYDCDVQRWRHASNVEAALGGCIEKRFGEVAETEGVYYICQNREWRKAADIEKDTYGWKTGNDADVKYGDVVKTNCYVFEDSVWRSGESTDCSLGLRGCTALRQDTVGKGSDKVYHICDAKSWRDATTYEKDTFGWKDSTDGAIKKGDVTDTVYVFDKPAWRVTSNIETKLGGCVSAIADSVGKVGSKYYICKSNKWVEASAIEYDTYRWVAGKDGDSKLGSVNADKCYVYEDNAWRAGNETDCSLGLRGCTKLRQDTVAKGSDMVWYICDSKTWRNATDIEKDTATWGEGNFDGEVRAGQVNKNRYYIYEKSRKVWRTASVIEKDTYDYENNQDWGPGEDGEIRKGSVTNYVYVYDVEFWREADYRERELGGCVASIADSIGLAEKYGFESGEKIYFVCKEREWIPATVTQYDTYRQNCTDFGRIIHGNVNQEFAYFCYGEYWKRFYGNESITYGKLVDERDGNVYRAVQIGSQTWMAENLNYADSANYPSMLGRNWCLAEEDSCFKYGRYYSWSAVMDSVNLIKQGFECGWDEDDEKEGSCKLQQKVQGVCPKGWHLPSVEEWRTLYTSTGSSYKTISAKGFEKWNKKGTDDYGISLLPSGATHVSSPAVSYFFQTINGAGEYTVFWTSTENNAQWAYKCEFDDKSDAILTEGDKYNGYSVRCVKD